MATNFFLYARKSTESEERQILSIEAQIAELRAFAEKEKLYIKEEFIEAMTAKEPGRPIFNKMMEKIEKGEAEGIISWHPDRLARNSVDGGRVIYFLDKGFIKHLKCPTFWFENTPQGKFMMNIAFGQSKYYIDNLSENVKRGIRQRLRRGEWPNLAPFGYLNDKETKKVKVDPVSGHLVKKLFETFASEGYNLPKLQEIALEWGLVSRRANKKLSKSEIQRTLKNPFYYGLMRFGGELHQGIHEPLVTKETFDRVQLMMQKKGKPGKFRKHEFPLSRFMTCATCGCAITAELQKGHHYYRCTGKKGKCDEPYTREEILDQQITQAIQEVALPKNHYTKMLAELVKEEHEASQRLHETRAIIATPLNATKEQLDKLLDAYLKAFITEKEYIQKKEGLLLQKVELEEKLNTIERKGRLWLEPCREFLQAAHQAHELAETKNLAAKREVLKKIGSNFRLSDRTLSFSCTFPWPLLKKSRPISHWRRGRDSNPRTS